MNRRSFEGVPSAFEGARSAIYAAEAAEVEGVSGKYYFKEAEEPRLSTLAHDPDAAEALWNKSMSYLTEFCNQLTSPRPRLTVVKSSQY